MAWLSRNAVHALIVAVRGKLDGRLRDDLHGRPGVVKGPVLVAVRPSGRGDAGAPGLPSPHLGAGIAAEWPLRDVLELGALPGAVPCARLHARHVLWDWGLAHLSESVELVVSELVTNAVAASRFTEWVLPVGLWLLSDKVRVLILVWDTSPQPPVRVNPGEDTEGGRGLMLVEAISERWDWYATPELGGKAVWAICAA